jgi:hypothetical protein
VKLRQWLSVVILLLLTSYAYAQFSSVTLQSAATSGNGTAFNVIGQSQVAVSIIGSSGSDRVVSFEASQDGTNYTAVLCRDISSTATATSQTASSTTLFQWLCPVGGMRSFRTPVSGGTTGSVTVKASALPNVSSAGSSFGGGGGSPAGSGTELQRRAGGSFGAVTGSTWDGTTLTLPPTTSMGGLTTTAPSGSLGSELALAINNTNWSVNNSGTGWESPVTGGVLNKNADGGGFAKPTVNISFTVGQIYRLVMNITTTVAGDGKLNCTLGGVPCKSLSLTVGTTTFTEDLTPNTTGVFAVIGNNTSRFTINSISIKRWDQNTGTVASDGRMTAHNGLYVAGGAIGLGTAPRPNTGFSAQWDSGPAIVLEGAATQGNFGALSGNTAMPVMAFKTGYNATSVGTIFGANGSETTATYKVISGRFTASIDSTGKYTVTNSGQTNNPSMLEISPDVENGITVRNVIDSYALTLIDNGTLTTDPYNRHWILASGGQTFLAAPAAGNVLTGAPVMTLTLTGGGSGCASTAPAVSFSGGGCTTNPTASATASGGVVQTLTLITTGRGCTSAPSVTFGSSCTGQTVNIALADISLRRKGAGNYELKNPSGSGFATMTYDGPSGGCLMIRDTDGIGWTKCKASGGTLTCTTDADGVCD